MLTDFVPHDTPWNQRKHKMSGLEKFSKSGGLWKNFKSAHCVLHFFSRSVMWYKISQHDCQLGTDTADTRNKFKCIWRSLWSFNSSSDVLTLPPVEIFLLSLLSLNTLKMFTVHLFLYSVALGTAFPTVFSCSWNDKGVFERFFGGGKTSVLFATTIAMRTGLLAYDYYVPLSIES